MKKKKLQTKVAQNVTTFWAIFFQKKLTAPLKSGPNSKFLPNLVTLLTN
jgi:hypothetical protein